jgi:glycosyltransferase involved in cell wall biosynthesis
MTMTDNPTPSPCVLHAVDELGPDVQSLLVVATEQLLRAGVRPTLLYSRDTAHGRVGSSFFDPRVRLIELPLPAQRSPWALARSLRSALIAELRSTRYDAVHLHSFAAGVVGRMALAANASQSPPIFYSPHGLRCLNARRPWSNAVYGAVERLAGWVDCQPVGASASEAQWLAQLTGRTAPVLESPVAADFFNLARQPDEQPLVVAVGLVDEQQGADLVAAIAARFHFAEQAVRFVWVGEGDARFEQALRAAGVDVTGVPEADTVGSWLARAHVFVQASRAGGPSLPLRQALSAGVPCVVSDVAGHRDAITHGVTGLICRDVSAFALQIKALLDAPGRARALAEAARREARRRFSAQRFRGELLWLYGLDSAVSPHRRAASRAAVQPGFGAAR